MCQAGKRRAISAIRRFLELGFTQTAIAEIGGVVPATIGKILNEPEWSCSSQLADILEMHLATIETTRLRNLVGQMRFEIQELCSNVKMTPPIKAALERCIESRLLAAFCPGGAKLRSFPRGIPGALVTVGFGQERVSFIVVDTTDPNALRVVAHELDHVRQRCLMEADRADRFAAAAPTKPAF